jgi:hypothetical protein
VFLLLSVSLAAPVVAGPFEDGVAAHSRGDYATALRLFRPLADQGVAEAQFNLGAMYDNGEGVPQNQAEAVRWYRKAAYQGSAPAQYGLAGKYHDGQGVPKNDAEAASWYRKAADQGEATAQGRLGVMYLAGVGVPRDNVQAYMWLNLSAARGIKRAAEERDKLAQSMTPAQIAQAQKLAREWKPTVGR